MDPISLLLEPYLNNLQWSFRWRIKHFSISPINRDSTMSTSLRPAGDSDFEREIPGGGHSIV